MEPFQSPAISPIETVGHSELIPKPPQLLADQRVQLSTFGHLLAQFFSELLHLVGEGFVIVFHFFRAHVAAGGEHMAVLGDFGQGHTAAKACNVLVIVSTSSPCGHGLADAFDHLIGQLALHAADHGGLFAGVDEQHFAFALFLFGQEPQARGNLCVEEQLAG